MTRAAGTRAAWIVDPEIAVVVTAATDARRGEWRACWRPRRLASCGYLGGGVPLRAQAGLETGSTPAIDIPELARRLESEELALSTSVTSTSGRKVTWPARSTFLTTTSATARRPSW